MTSPRSSCPATISVNRWTLGVALGFCCAVAVIAGSFLAFLVVFEQRLSMAKLVTCLGVILK